MKTIWINFLASFLGAWLCNGLEEKGHVRLIQDAHLLRRRTGDSLSVHQEGRTETPVRRVTGQAEDARMLQRLANLAGGPEAPNPEYLDELLIRVQQRHIAKKRWHETLTRKYRNYIDHIQKITKDVEDLREAERVHARQLALAQKQERRWEAQWYKTARLKFALEQSFLSQEALRKRAEKHERMAELSWAEQDFARRKMKAAAESFQHDDTDRMLQDSLDKLQWQEENRVKEIAEDIYAFKTYLENEVLLRDKAMADGSPLPPVQKGAALMLNPVPHSQEKVALDMRTTPPRYRELVPSPSSFLSLKENQRDTETDTDQERDRDRQRERSDPKEAIENECKKFEEDTITNKVKEQKKKVLGVEDDSVDVHNPCKEEGGEDSLRGKMCKSKKDLAEKYEKIAEITSAAAPTEEQKNSLPALQEEAKQLEKDLAINRGKYNTELAKFQHFEAQIERKKGACEALKTAAESADNPEEIDTTVETLTGEVTTLEEEIQGLLDKPPEEFKEEQRTELYTKRQTLATKKLKVIALNKKKKLAEEQLEELKERAEALAKSAERADNPSNQEKALATNVGRMGTLEEAKCKLFRVCVCNSEGGTIFRCIAFLV
uniref:DUF4200 domain-containing protein n=1 Tax=Chromera velia CCMP2878 TaxID=1169474 RepID=A0A0G4G8I8_9ALVE|eukprot:Cvel_20633.t1-p1 / transcript=Cvel_20633.t1 / gene=Cvel_20633 / organism=Chromera_velia_CCMP2878 / gene_product=hypothetical protein / transcript_product=hypothetical protein / location=Cvel_scaffold1870:10859-19956(+) / protein_length=605 / sequence_SO=supercontig / SO=protein_coding / is_pseudo=false